MNNRTTMVLLILFFAALIGLWWAESAKVPTNVEARRREGLVLPALADVATDDIWRVEIDREGQRPAVFERQDGDRWQMRTPVDATADRSMLDSLVTHLKGLKRRPDAETIRGASAATYGLDRPACVVEVFDRASKGPRAAIELGKTIGDRRYVREVGGDGVEVVDARPLAAVDRPAADWRDKGLFHLSTFEVEALSARGPGRDLGAGRIEGHWRLTRPIHALADATKVEGILADLVGLQVADGAKGYVADDVRDLASYGLDRPALTIELTPARGPLQAIEIGKDVPGQAGRAYARRADQDDVVVVETKGLNDLGKRPVALRSQRIADLDLERVDAIEIHEEGVDHALARRAGGWVVLKPAPGKADDRAIGELLARLNDAQTSEFLEPSKAHNPGLDPPSRVIKVWEGGNTDPVKAEATELSARGEPALTLRLGRHDAVAKVVYARTDDDPTVLTLLDKLMESLPTGPLAFRDRTIRAQGRGRIDRVTVRRDGTIYAVEALGAPSDYARWKLIKPIEAPADPEAVGRLTILLAGLRAESLATDHPEDAKTYGLDEPAITVTWSFPDGASRPAGAAPKREEASLDIGKAVPGHRGSRFVSTSGSSTVFTIGPMAVEILEGELRDRRVLTFPADQVSRLVLKWPGRSASFDRRPKPLGGPPDWAPVPGSDLDGLSPSRINPLVQSLAALRALRFTQYQGPIAPASGLSPPRLRVEVELVGEAEPRRLLVGEADAQGRRSATMATGAEGAVFLLPGADWSAWVSPPGRLDDLPEDVFARDPAP